MWLQNKYHILVNFRTKKTWLLMYQNTWQQVIASLSAWPTANFVLLWKSYYVFLHIFKVRLSLLLHDDHFLVWCYFKFITTKEPNIGNYSHIFSQKDCSVKIYAYNCRY